MEDRAVEKPEVLVVGTGAIGGFYGAKLAQAGAKVSVVSRTDYISVRAAGIRIKSPLSDFTFIPAGVYNHAADYPGRPDIILVGLKVLPEIDIRALLAPAMGPGTAIVLLQNGVHIEEPVAAAFPENEIVSGLAFVCLSRPGPGLIHHQCYGKITLGPYGGPVSTTIRSLAALFQSAGIECTIEEDILRARWRKLVWNAPFNPISVLAGGVSTKQILDLDDTRHLTERIMEEICMIAKADGCPLGPEVIQQHIQATLNMTPYKTSMLQDYLAGRPMEIEALVGRPLAIARKHQLPVPYLETLYGLLRLVEFNQQERRKFGKSIMKFFRKND